MSQKRQPRLAVKIAFTDVYSEEAISLLCSTRIQPICRSPLFPFETFFLLVEIEES